MSHSFNYAIVNAQTCTDKILAVACYSRSFDVELVAGKVIYLLQLCCDNIQRLSPIGAVVLVKQPALWGHKHQLCGGGACIYAQVCIPLVCADVLVFKV